MDGTHASLRATRNPLSENSRAHVIDLLNRTLAAAIDLQAQAKQAHWNVRGANFIALHELFDGVAGVLTSFVDQLAERVTALGGIALGTIIPTIMTAHIRNVIANSAGPQGRTPAISIGIDIPDMGMSIDDARRTR